MSSEQRIGKQDTAAFFTGSALLSRSLAPSHIFMSPTFFSPLSLSLFLPLSLLSVRLLVFRTQQLPCPYCTVCAISEWSLLLVQPACELRWSQTTTSWLWPYGGCAHTQREPGVGTWKRERNREKEMRQKNIHWHSRGYYSYRCALALKQRPDSDWLQLFFHIFLWRRALRLWNIA